eukprot:9830773-Heterocapsa_arctica.AAC.1
MSPNCCGVRVSSGSPRRRRAGWARFFPAAQSRQNALKGRCVQRCSMLRACSRSPSSFAIRRCLRP